MNTTRDLEKWAKLMNREYLVSALRSGKTRAAIASEIGCDRKTLRRVLEYHNITRPYAEIHNLSLKDTISKI